MAFLYNCIGRCLFIKPKEKVRPILLNNLSYRISPNNATLPSLSISQKKIDYNESIAYQLA